MTYFADLEPCDYFGLTTVAFLRAVGWLEAGKAFRQGSVNAHLRGRLGELFKQPWQPVLAMGGHQCDLCPRPFRGRPPAYSTSNLFVPADGIAYVCPEGIQHYIDAHGYQPPEEFCDAVLDCPDPRSEPYRRRIFAAVPVFALDAGFACPFCGELLGFKAKQCLGCGAHWHRPSALQPSQRTPWATFECARVLAGMKCLRAFVERLPEATTNVPDFVDLKDVQLLLQPETLSLLPATQRDQLQTAWQWLAARLGQSRDERPGPK